MKALDRNKLGELITKLRKSRDLSLDGMGELLHVSGRTVRRWEKGDILPTMEDVINICNEFNLSLEEIYEGEISIDREVGRKLSRVDSNIEAIGLKMTTTEESVKSISDGLIEIKNQITKSDDQEDLTWLVLLAMHLFFTGAAFLCYVMWRLDVKWTLYLSIIYIVRLSQLIIMNRNNMKSQKLFFLYSLLLLLNMLINYVLFADITVGVINNIELILVNGAMYGLRLLDFNNMEALLDACLMTYSAWIIYCGYNLIKSKRKRGKADNK